jgi:predicted type IV restriction endonuclease
MKTPEVIESLTCTTSSYEPSYVFEIALSDLALERLSKEVLLGCTFRKSKYQFLNELADILKIEILQHLERLYENT